MYATDRDALLCDMAETYGVFDFGTLPASTLAVLAVGLPPDCRVKRKKTGAETDDLTMLLALVIDRLSMLVWMQSEDARHHRNRPKSLVGLLTAKPERRGGDDIEVFDTPDAFMTARAIALMEMEG